MIQIQLPTPPSLYTKQPEFLQIEHLSSGLFLPQKEFRHQKRFLTCFELLYVVSGSLCMEEGGERWRVLENEYLFLSPYQTSRGFATAPEDTSFYWIDFSTNDFGHFQIPGRHDACLDPSAVIPLMDRITRPLRKDKYLADIYTAVLLSEISAMQMHKPMPAVIQAIVEWVREGPAATMTARKAGERFGYHQDYLCRLFKRHCGQGLKQFIDGEILKRAKVLMRTSHTSISHIAEILDFPTPNHFNKFFKYHTGVSPQAFRKAHLR